MSWKQYVLEDDPATAWRVVLVITAVVFAVRLAYVLVAPSVDPVLQGNDLYADAIGYDMLAENIVAGNGLSWEGDELTAYRAPGYPFFLAVVYSVFGRDFTVVRIIHALLGALTCVPVFWLGRWVAGRPLAILSALGIGFQPLYLYLTGWIYTESLFISLFWFGLWGMLLVYERGDLKYIIGSGVLMGIGVLIRPQFLLLPTGIFMLGMVLRWQDWRIWGRFMAVQLALILTLLPWSYRNYRAFDTFILISTELGPNLYGANNPNADGAFAPDENGWRIAGLTELESEEVFMERATTWIRENPDDFARLVPQKLIKFYSPLVSTTTNRSLGRIEPIANVIYGLFLLLAFAGGIWLWWRKKGQAEVLLWSVVIYATLLTMVFHGGARLALPIAPALIIFAGYALVEGGQLMLNRRAHGERRDVS